MSKTILVVQRRIQDRYTLRKLLGPERYTIVETHDPLATLNALNDNHIDLVILDAPEADDDLDAGLELLAQISATHTVPVVLTADHSAPDLMRAGAKHGAYDVLVRPLTRTMVLSVVRVALASRNPLSAPAPPAPATAQTRDDLHYALLGTSPRIQRVVAQLQQRAPRTSPVLLVGEHGTGKHHAVLSLHAQSPRAERALVRVDCAATPHDQLHGVLFGQREPSLPHTTITRSGALEHAHASTLVLGHIDALPLDLQLRILEILDRGQLTPVGASTSRLVDLRLIATTCIDLRTAVRRGAFLDALQQRLAPHAVRMPPLRERTQDLPDLAGHLLRRRASSPHPPALDGATLAAMMRYTWPGNIRELSHTIDRAFLTVGDDPGAINAHLTAYCSEPSAQPPITFAPLRDLHASPPPAALGPAHDSTPHGDANADTELAVEQLRHALTALLALRHRGALQDVNLTDLVEGHLVELALDQTEGNKSQAARLLNIKRKAVERRVIKLLGHTKHAQDA